jgi:molybdopterin molybdotransferase
MLPLEQAQEQILQRVQPLVGEYVPLLHSAGRVLAENIVAPLDLPGFDNSAMDGYAVRADDVAQASPATPVALQLLGAAPAGQVFSGQVGSGQSVRVFTGSALPSGADAVVIQEDTRLDPATPGQPLILASAKPWDNIRFRGEDIRRGAAAAQAGTRVSAAQAALLAALGYRELPVRRRPVVGLIATGSELREPGHPLAPGEIYESNRVTLAMLAAQAGAETRTYPLVPDELPATEKALQTALSECDALISSGGVSVGEKDLVRAAWARVGGDLSFWRVAVKPGKPFALGQHQSKLLFALPGNPVSAFVTFLLLVRPALLKLQGDSNLGLPVRPGVLEQAIVNRSDRRHFVRVIVDAQGRVRSAGTQASHALSCLARANGLLDVPPLGSLPAGSGVTVLTWE